MISEKKIYIYLLQSEFEGKNILQGNTRGKQYPALKKKSLMGYNAGKKILHRCIPVKKKLSPEVWEKNSYPNQITPTPLKSQMVNPFKELCHKYWELPPK